MNASDTNSPINDSSYTRERLELETRVLAAALRQSLEIGDTEGSSLAHEQIFLLLKASQEMVIDEPINLPRELYVERGRKLPDIDWGSSEPAADGPVVGLPETPASDGDGNGNAQVQVQVQVQGQDQGQADVVSPPVSDNNFAPPQAPAEIQSQGREDIQVQVQTDPHVRALTEAPAEVPSTAPSAESEIEKPSDYYSELHVTDIADFASIHLSFWRQLRVLLRLEVGLVGPGRLPHLKVIQRLWIAHDILTDPVTKADYDFRRMGLRGDDIETQKQSTTRGPRTQLRIGELLQCAGLLEQTELDIAADMHKAMPEMMFGTFLVKQGFIEEADLDCVLVGQQLLKTGDITVVQFQTVMIERSATGLDIGEMLLAKGYVNEFMLERAYRNQSEDTLVKVPAVLAVGQHTTIEFKPHPERFEPVEEAAPEPPQAEADQAEANEGEAAYAASMDTGEYSAAVSPAAAELYKAQAEAQAQALAHAQALVQSQTQVQSQAQAEPVVAEPFVLGGGAADDESPAAGQSLVERVEAARATLSDTNFITERTLKISNAAPAWKDQLDWSSPDSVEDDAAAASSASAESAESESAPEPPPAEAVPPRVVAPLTPDALADSVRAIAQIWAEDVSPANSWARLDTPANPTPEPSSESVSGLDLDTTGPLSAVEDDPSESLTTGDNPFVAGDAAHDMPPPDNVSSEPPAESSPSDSSPGGDMVSEIETSSQLPSLIELEARVQSKEKKADQDKPRPEPKRGTGDWQIMSVPGSALTSLFLDEVPEEPNAFITETRDEQYQTGPQRVHPQGEAEVGSEQNPPQQPQAAPTPPPAPAPPNREPDGPADGESRRARRRHTRS